MRDRCSNCYFGDKCHKRHGCEYYSPMNELLDVSTSYLIRTGRKEFMEEWQEYIKEYED